MGYQVIPAGAVQYFARDIAPEGWLVADGRDVSRTQYADLFAAIRVKFGMGDGIDTFGLPDLRGEFIRGMDGGRGLDGGRIFGSIQGDSVRAPEGYGFIRRSLPNENNTTGAVDVGGSGSEPDVVSSPIKGGNETRPRNIALLACIKY